MASEHELNQVQLINLRRLSKHNGVIHYMKRKTDDAVILEMIKDGKQQKEVAEYMGVSPSAICQRLKRLLPPNEQEALGKLSEKEQKFALAIAEGKTQTDAAMASFEVSNRNSAKSLGCTLMKQQDMQTAVAEIMQRNGLSRGYRVQKLKEHIDNKDPAISLRALDQGWRIDGYVDRVTVEHKLTYSEVDQRRRENLKEQIRLLRELGKDRQADLVEQQLELEIIDVEPEEID